MDAYTRVVLVRKRNLKSFASAVRSLNTASKMVACVPGVEPSFCMNLVLSIHILTLGDHCFLSILHIKN